MGYIPVEERKKLGILKRFDVYRVDGRDQLGEKHHDCEYFVLDLTHDPFAIPAIRAYADACKEEFGVLAFNLYEKAKEIEKAKAVKE
jgi:hypothetical protein